MINKYVKYSIDNGNLTVEKKSSRSLLFKYPCYSKDVCSPYKLEINPGTYLFECWGAKGKKNKQSKPGLGAYTSGYIFFLSKTTLYVFIGSTGQFNTVVLIVTVFVFFFFSCYNQFHLLINKHHFQVF